MRCIDCAGSQGVAGRRIGCRCGVGAACHRLRGCPAAAAPGHRLLVHSRTLLILITARIVKPCLLQSCAVINSNRRIRDRPIGREIFASACASLLDCHKTCCRRRISQHARLSCCCAGSWAASGACSGAMGTRNGWRPPPHPAPRSRPPSRAWATFTATWRATRRGRAGATSARWRWTRCKPVQVCAEPWRVCGVAWRGLTECAAASDPIPAQLPMAQQCTWRRCYAGLT